jgi:hypothetical protein
MIIAVAVLLVSPSAASLTKPTFPAAVAASAASGGTSGDAKGTSGGPSPLTPSASTTQPSKTTESKPVVGADPHPAPSIPPASALNLFLPPPSTFRPETEPVRHLSRAWFVLTATEHSAAGFDAWSTRQAVSQGRLEADPLMRPFAHSGAIYGAIQVVPLGLDYFARRMQRSSGWTRHVWWVPQSLATASFLFSGSYNFSHMR